MGSSHQEEVEHAAVNADRHPQCDLAGTGDTHAHLIQPLLHSPGRGAATNRMLVTGEKEQQGISTEFEEAGPEGVGGSEQLMEGGCDHRSELLSPELPMLGQSLGHRSEPRNVNEDHGPFETLVQLAGRLLVPVPHHARQVGLR